MAAATVRIRRLICNTTEDSTGADEAYLQLNGNQIWNGDLNDGDTAIINQYHTFNGEVRLDLYDEDWPDADDFLGSISVRDSEAGDQTSVRSQVFNLDGAHYILTYSVFAAVDPP